MFTARRDVFVCTPYLYAFRIVLDLLYGVKRRFYVKTAFVRLRPRITDHLGIFMKFVAVVYEKLLITCKFQDSRISDSDTVRKDVNGLLPYTPIWVKFGVQYPYITF